MFFSWKTPKMFLVLKTRMKSVQNMFVETNPHMTMQVGLSHLDPSQSWRFQTPGTTRK